MRATFAVPNKRLNIPEEGDEYCCWVEVDFSSDRSSLSTFCLPLRHSHDKLFQSLSRSSVLQGTESWVGPGNEASDII